MIFSVWIFGIVLGFSVLLTFIIYAAEMMEKRRRRYAEEFIELTSRSLADFDTLYGIYLASQSGGNGESMSSLLERRNQEECNLLIGLSVRLRWITVRANLKEFSDKVEVRLIATKRLTKLFSDGEVIRHAMNLYRRHCPAESLTYNAPKKDVQ